MEDAMNVPEVLTRAQDAVTVKRVYGEPIEKDGLTIIPAAAVAGGGGGGSGGRAEQTGGGVGYGVSARPVGAYVIKDGAVSWSPAVDATRIALRGILVPIVALFVFRSVVKALTKRR